MWSEPEMTFPHLRGVERSATPRRWGKRARFSGLMAFGHSWSLEVLKLTAPTMTKHQVQHDELTDGAINTLLQFGLADGLPRVAEMLLNAAMILERTAHIGAAPHQRSQDRNGYANGFKPRTYHSAIGKLDLRIPQTRDSDEPFRPSLLESGSRTDKALKAAIAEIYLGGTSTRKVSAVMEKLCNHSFCASGAGGGGLVWLRGSLWAHVFFDFSQPCGVSSSMRRAGWSSTRLSTSMK
jgi:hypothetical protein